MKSEESARKITRFENNSIFCFIKGPKDIVQKTKIDHLRHLKDETGDYKAFLPFVLRR